jgi:phosphoserine aminotransferase
MRIDNFSAGPSVLPVPVLERAAREMLNCGGAGMGVMEMSHRSKAFEGILATTEQRLRELLSVPHNYKVLFLQGGATTQFSMVPLNLLRQSRKADYVDTGVWASKAADEARKFGDIKVVASSKPDRYTRLPELADGFHRADADYIHLTSNNTIYGTAFERFPHTGSVPLVADMSSDFLARPVDVSQFGLIYAGAQKNAGCAGLTLVLIREDLIGHAGPHTPLMLDYTTHANNDSMYNTPPTWSIYIAGLVFDWIAEQGGLSAIEANNRAKAGLLYDFLDQSRLFRATVSTPYRSLMNVPFLLANEEQTTQFLREAQARGLDSLYNALPLSSVEKLVAFMDEFERARR